MYDRMNNDDSLYAHALSAMPELSTLRGGAIAQTPGLYVVQLVALLTILLRECASWRKID